MRLYSEPDTPDTWMSPPLALATFCTSICKVDSRPRNQKAPPSSMARLATAIST